MATSIRLKRFGAKKEASFRIVVTDSREGTAGSPIERLGTYNPRTSPSMIRLNAVRTMHWLNEGAQPSDTVRSILRKTGVWKQFSDGAAIETLEEDVIFLGPPVGQRSTSKRPIPTDRALKVEEPAPAPKAKKAPAGKAEAAAEPAAETEPAVEAEPVVEAEPAAEPEPVVEAEPTAEAEPVADAEPVAEAEPVVEAEPVAEAEEPDAEAETDEDEAKE
jgi:ribosomal protein S16